MTEITPPTPDTTKEVAAMTNAPAPEKAGAPTVPATTTATEEKPAATKRATRKVPAAAPAETTTSVLNDKETKVKKSKLVRDSFTIPKDEYLVVDLLKQRTAQLGHPAKKSELLRAGIKLLAGLSDAALRKAVLAVPTIKTGRPRADKPSEAVEKTKMKSSKK